MSDYHIQKSLRRITIKMHDSAMLAGDIFLQPYGRHGGGAERPIDILNAAELFFPVSADDGDTILVAKDQVIAVTCDRPSDEGDSQATVTRRATIEVRMVNGESFSATALLELPEDHSRLLDFLNRWKSRFLPLETAQGQLLINRRMIERVRSLD